MTLIERDTAIEAALDWNVRPDGEVFNAIKAAIRSRLEQVAAIDAIPVEWLVNLKNEYAREGREQAEGDLMNLLLMWQKEQETR